MIRVRVYNIKRKSVEQYCLQLMGGIATACSSQSELRLPLLQVVSNNKSFSVGVQSPTEINAPRGCAVILRRICQLSLTRITHQVSRAFDLISLCKYRKRSILSGKAIKQTTEFHEFLREWERPLFQAWKRAR